MLNIKGGLQRAYNSRLQYRLRPLPANSSSAQEDPPSINDRITMPTIMVDENHLSTSFSDELVSSEEVSAFKRGLMARRFPGLKQMSEADIKALIVAERRARGGRKTVIDKKVYPKTDFVPASPKRDAYIPEPAAFLPVNPSQAKFEASRKPWESFAGVGTPYDAHHDDWLDDKISDESKRAASQSFLPSCSSKAKSTIQVNYYLNSPMQQSLNGTQLRSTGRSMQGTCRHAAQTQ